MNWLNIDSILLGMPMRFELTFSAFLPLYVLGSVYLLPDAIVGSGRADDTGVTSFISVASVVSAWALVTMVIASVLLLLAFRSNFRFTSNWAGGKVVHLEPKNGTALSFYSAILIPLVTLCQFSRVGGVLCFWLSVLVSFALVYADCAFLSNPVLALFGLKTYRVECESEGNVHGQSVVSITVLTRRSLSEGDVVSGRKIGEGCYLVFDRRRK